MLVPEVGIIWKELSKKEVIIPNYTLNHTPFVFLDRSVSLALLYILSAIESYFSAYKRRRMREGKGGKTFLGITTKEGLGE